MESSPQHLTPKQKESIEQLAEVKRLKPKQREALELLAKGYYKAADVARKIGVHRSTVGRWMDQPKFQALSVAMARGDFKPLTPKLDWRLKPKQHEAAPFLAQGDSITDTASAIGVNPATIHRWMHKPAFTDLVELHRTGKLDEARSQ